MRCVASSASGSIWATPLLPVPERAHRRRRAYRLHLYLLLSCVFDSFHLKAHECFSVTHVQESLLKTLRAEGLRDTFRLRVPIMQHSCSNVSKKMDQLLVGLVVHPYITGMPYTVAFNHWFLYLVSSFLKEAFRSSSTRCSSSFHCTC